MLHFKLLETRWRSMYLIERVTCHVDCLLEVRQWHPIATR
jgi:hypothetical protein